MAHKRKAKYLLERRTIVLPDPASSVFLGTSGLASSFCWDIKSKNISGATKHGTTKARQGGALAPSRPTSSTRRRGEPQLVPLLPGSRLRLRHNRHKRLLRPRGKRTRGETTGRGEVRAADCGRGDGSRTRVLRSVGTL
ncbi:hypothetical protein NDU88_002502 [Pleurodeles waltl]|uniref:Uncharacterized protein n=1 Tax=Pleurodeles waltl TaxID=8319 RepID=A0AAV7NDT9_PLEWA|nr:hypothetical protein NDU88_002502 [Pleurodeles waltl]